MSLSLQPIGVDQCPCTAAGTNRLSSCTNEYHTMVLVLLMQKSAGWARKEGGCGGNSFTWILSCCSHIYKKIKQLLIKTQEKLQALTQGCSSLVSRREQPKENQQLQILIRSWCGKIFKLIAAFRRSLSLPGLGAERGATVQCVWWYHEDMLMVTEQGECSGELGDEEKRQENQTT